MADIDWPTNIVPKHEEWKALTNTQTFRSTFTGATHTAKRAGSRWGLTLHFAALKEADARRAFATVLQLNGQENRLIYRPQLRELANTGIVDVTNATKPDTGDDTYTATAGGALLQPGDWFIFNCQPALNANYTPCEPYELKQVVKIDGNTITYWPPARTDHTGQHAIRAYHSAAAATTAPRGRFILKNPAMLRTEPGPAFRGGFRLELEEDIT